MGQLPGVDLVDGRQSIRGHAERTGDLTDAAVDKVMCHGVQRIRIEYRSTAADKPEVSLQSSIDNRGRR